jgi:twitching motility protein PilT
MADGTFDKGFSGGGGAIEACLSRMREMRASDVFLCAGRPPAYRVDGRIVRTELPPLNEGDLQAFMARALTEPAKERFRNSPDVDLAYTVAGDPTRFRVNIFLHQGRVGIVARAIPSGAVAFNSLNLPAAILEMADHRSGLVLVVGPAGCGKSTTLAALLHKINTTRADHVVTIEDPIEFLHEEAMSLIHQRQVGYDTVSFPTALRHVVRQNPDVILIGEMRDADTIQTAMGAALTGHLILSTLHATNVVQAVERILNYFPPESRRQVQADLATTLVGAISMRLLPRAGGVGRVPACEMLRGVPIVRKLLAEGKLVEIYDTMKRGGDSGMCTMNQSLVALCKQGLVSQETALPYAPNPDEFRLNMQGMYTGIDSIDRRIAEANPPKEDDEGQGEEH